VFCRAIVDAGAPLVIFVRMAALSGEPSGGIEQLCAGINIWPR